MYSSCEVWAGSSKVPDKLGGMSMYIMQIQYLNEDWSKMGNDDCPREEVILLDNDLV